MWNICLTGSAGVVLLLPGAVGLLGCSPPLARGLPLRDAAGGPVNLGFVVLINLTQFKILTEEAYTVCNLSFWSISAVWQFFPTASLSENS